jgi:hypothetical protein
MPDDLARKQGARMSVVSRARIAGLPSLQSSYGSPFTSRFRCEYSTAFSRIYHIDRKHVHRGERNEIIDQLSLRIPFPLVSQILNAEIALTLLILSLTSRFKALFFR